MKSESKIPRTIGRNILLVPQARIFVFYATKSKISQICIKKDPVAGTYPRGRGRRGCAPLGVFGALAGRRPARIKTQAEATETLTEVTKSVRKPTKKHVRTVGAPLTSGSARKNRAPVTIRGPSDSQSHHQ